ncbi:MAG: hypothetical protein JNG88_10160 [Phycisphaerales bacterium]|nr:hypothetical protein [Phycisphaerales bacterium]
MSILDQLSCAKGERGETGNVRLAEKLASSKDKKSIAEVAAGLDVARRDIRNDCIKVLYELGAADPALIRPFAATFARLLAHKDNRMVWGAMTALDAIAAAYPGDIVEHLPAVNAAAKTGSVITRDHAIGILVKLAALPAHRKRCLNQLAAHLEAAPPNQVGMYAEIVAPLLKEPAGKNLAAILERRIDDLPKESQQRRVCKVLNRAKPAN